MADADDLPPGRRRVSSWREASDLLLADAAERHGREVRPRICNTGPGPHTEVIWATHDEATRRSDGTYRSVCGVCGRLLRMGYHAGGVSWLHEPDENDFAACRLPRRPDR